MGSVISAPAARSTLRPEVGRMEAFQLCTTALERWLDEADTDSDLTNSIVEYVRWRGTVTMEDAIIDAPPRFSYHRIRLGGDGS